MLLQLSLLFYKIQASFRMTRRMKTYLLILFGIALSAPFIATEKPWYVHYQQQNLFPAFSLKQQIKINDQIISYEETDWKHLDAEKIIFAPVPWLQGKSDFDNAGYISPSGEQFFRDKHGKTIKMPLRFRHWLGTDKRGADVLSGLLNGARVSLFVGILSMLIASFLGLLSGAFAGFAGNDLIKLKRGLMLMLIPGVVIAFFYANVFSSDNLFIHVFQFIFVFLFVLAIFYGAGLLLSLIGYFQVKKSLPVDLILSRVIEWVVSIPRLILVLSIAAIARPSLFNLALLIGCTGWTEIARLTRAEFLKHRELDYVQSAKALGYSNWRIAIKHILPNAITPALTAILFGISAAILAEAGLSFLGIGVPQNIVTWGNMLAAGKENFQAWWLVVFPGAALFLTVLLFNSIGEKLRSR